MQRKFVVPMVAAGLAAGAVAWSYPGATVAAGGGNGAASAATLDTDGDFLPDAVEWVLLTDPNNPDTDGDQTPDFVEVVEGGRPRHESAPLPPDQDMRLVVTGPTPGSCDPRTWMHVFYRVFTSQTQPGAGAGAIQSFEIWLERPAWPGVAIPLNSFAAGGVVYQERATANQGIWVQFSIPLVSEQVLLPVLPCTIWAEAMVGGRTLRSGMTLIDTPDGIMTIVPFGDGRFVVQRLTPLPPTVPLPVQSNRVCVLDLTELSTGPAGTTYEVVHAECEDANELECPNACPQSVGWTITIPGGTPMIGGH